MNTEQQGNLTSDCVGDTSKTALPEDPRIAAIMHNVRQYAIDFEAHTGESTGNLDILRRRIEDGVRELAGLRAVQPELAIATESESSVTQEQQHRIRKMFAPAEDEFGIRIDQKRGESMKTVADAFALVADLTGVRA